MNLNLPPFQRLVDAHGSDVWRYLCATVGPAGAADCYQETMLAALRTYPRLRDAANLRGWLLTIAHRKAIDGWRAAARRPVPVPDRDLPEGSAAPAELRDAELWAAVRRLPPKQRGAVALRFVADLAYTDIGEALGCSEGAARQSVRAGLARLRQELTHHEEVAHA